MTMLTFNEFHSADLKQPYNPEAFLVCSILMSVTSIMVASILLFGFEEFGRVTWRDLILAWAPIITLDGSILAFLMGLLLWSSERNGDWGIPVFGPVASVLLVIIICVSLNTFLIVSRTGGQGKEGKSSSLAK